MKKLNLIMAFGLLTIMMASCGQPKQVAQNSDEKDSVSVSNDSASLANESAVKEEKTIKFLWRGDEYDDELQQEVNTIFINEKFCKTITAPEKAVLGYVATFIGSDCWWDGGSTEDQTNLKCKILTALDLGYQCSEKHLGFLRQWFRNDKKAMEALKDCPIIPYTATIQTTFDEITLTVKGDELLVYFKATGVNMRESENWSWTETDHFKVNGDEITLVKKDKSKVKTEHYELVD